jgi:mRNA interferase RelE/StbE
MAYQVSIYKSAVKAIKKLGPQATKEISNGIQALAQNPRTTKVEKLAGCDYYRLRVGNYRVIFAISDASKTVDILCVGDRKDVYRWLEQNKKR